MENENTIAVMYQMIQDIQGQLARVQHLLQQISPIDEQKLLKEKAEREGTVVTDAKEVIVEGVFDGQHMVGPDGKMYTVPANYASKSKLLEGDLMKLTIKDDGSFIYKQIGPVERTRDMGALIKDEQGTFRAVTKSGRSYKLLTASVTYYKGESGDSVALLLPQDGQCAWAAVETIIKGSAPVITAPAEHETIPLMQQSFTDDPLASLLDDLDLSTGNHHAAGVATEQK